ncbi:IDEAL domain-containing protein [Neobacillus drentensis]|jgi:uncharacterized protein YpiB (UPF0302 family)|uniref:IDEAL domain-containing protein n=1 Tax=Neobacillus drentensis TaxID=220684 RepID=UPI002FFE970D
MRKLLCKNCGNAEFYVINMNETLCKCGNRLSKLSDYRWEESKKWKEVYHEEQKRQTELIFKISLLKRKIDTCLDEGDKERFKKLTSELKACQTALKTGTPNPKARLRERVQHNRDIV